jgi:hypothetical protein
MYHVMRFIVPVLFFISTLWLVIGTGGIVNSPDENANRIFATAFLTDGSLFVDEPLNAQIHGLISPRSAITSSDKILPGSFLGLPLYFGAIGVIVGTGGMMLITPILAILALLAWRGTVKKLTEDDIIADLSALFLMIHPAFWLYTGRTMMHNVAFLSLMIFAAYFFVARPIKKRGAWNIALAGLMLGAAIAFRTSEVIWILPIVLWGTWMARKTLTWKKIVLGITMAAIALLPIAITQTNLFGAPWEFGYNQISDHSLSDFITLEGPGAPPLEVASESSHIVASIGAFILPFGFHEKAILRHVWQYGFLLYPWMSALTLIGVGIVLAKKEKRNHVVWKPLLILTILLSIWLGIFYGSWTFHDNPDPNIYSLGNSYVRYWLPLFLLASPFAALAAQEVTSLIKNKHARVASTTAVVIIFIALSGNLVFFGEDGFVKTHAALATFEEKKEIILSVTEEESVIIVDRADKYLYPDRRVIVPLRSDITYAAMPTIVKQVPLYYFGITLPKKDLNFLNETQLQDGLLIEPVITISEETLYRISNE